MTKRKQAMLASINDLKKCKEDNPSKRQKSDHPQPRPGEENANVSSVSGNGEGHLKDQGMDSDVPTPELQGLQPIFQCEALIQSNLCFQLL